MLNLKHSAIPVGKGIDFQARKDIQESYFQVKQARLKIENLHQILNFFPNFCPVLWIENSDSIISVSQTPGGYGMKPTQPTDQGLWWGMRHSAMKWCWDLPSQSFNMEPENDGFQ